ncbi:aldo/keto reductase [Methylophilus sp. Leaf414]|uniref:aldo/keto reductase n=1 Tax=Methylophilus sp. Leaf414 TaxID=1736371 RepID=UPI0006F1C687|nr:aldo/keto reductase [Methylophilus sp. Leaf414]KQT38192.1 oxidoreductase [Methylophilus sp. Leaf414]
MKFKVFGRNSGLRVSELALGTGNFGTGWGHGAEPEEAKKIFDQYVSAGGNFFDTANAYQRGESESLLGDFIASDRDQFVVATKYSNATAPDAGISRTGNSRKNMVRAVEESLKRLKTDRIDLYWVHISDGVTPMEEILRGLDDLVRSGKVIYAGLSNFPAWRIARADLMADLKGWSPIIGIQIEYSLAERSPDRELIPMAESLGLGITTWSPLGGGFLTGKYREHHMDTRLTKLGMLVHTEKSEKETELLNMILSIADELGASPTHIAIAWLLDKAARSTTSIIPILGPRTVEQLDATLGALDISLPPEMVARLDAASAVALGVPHEQINSSYRSLSGGNDLQVLIKPA